MRLTNFITSIFEAVPTLDTAAHASGDVLANPVAITLPRLPQDNALLRLEVTHLQLLDESAQSQPLEVVLMRANQSLGTLNAAVSISDAAARDIVGIIPVLAGDYKALVGSSQAIPQFNPIPIELNAATLYLALISRGTGTYAADAIRARLGIRFHNIDQW